MSGSVPVEGSEPAAPEEAAPVPSGVAPAVDLPHSSATDAAPAAAPVAPELFAQASGAPSVMGADLDAAAAVDTKFEDAPLQPTDGGAAVLLQLNPPGEPVAEGTTEAAVEPQQTDVAAPGAAEQAGSGGGADGGTVLVPTAAAPGGEAAEAPAAAVQEVQGLSRLPVGVHVDVAMASDDDGSDSPDEVPLNGEGGPGAGLGTVVQPVVAGVPQAAPRSGAAAPAVAIPVGGMHVAADPAAAGGGAKADAAAPGAYAPGPVVADGTMLAEHPPLTPVHAEVLADDLMEDAAMPDALQEATAEPAVGAVDDAGGAAAPAAEVQQDLPDGGAASADLPAGKPGAGKAVGTVAVHSQPAKLSSRRRGRGSGAAAAAAVSAPAPAVEAAVVSDGDVAQPATGMRTRGRGTSAQAAAIRLQDEATDIKTYVRRVMAGFKHPETTLVRELRLEMEQRFGVKLNTFMERKDDVADALGEFFTDMGYAERC